MPVYHSNLTTYIPLNAFINRMNNILQINVYIFMIHVYAICFVIIRSNGMHDSYQIR